MEKAVELEHLAKPESLPWNTEGFLVWGFFCFVVFWFFCEVPSFQRKSQFKWLGISTSSVRKPVHLTPLCNVPSPSLGDNIRCANSSPLCCVSSRAPGFSWKSKQVLGPGYIDVQPATTRQLARGLLITNHTIKLNCYELFYHHFLSLNLAFNSQLAFFHQLDKCYVT